MSFVFQTPGAVVRSASFTSISATATVVAGETIIVCCGFYRGSGSPTASISVDSGTWAWENDNTFGYTALGGSVNRCRGSVWIGTAPSSGTFTFTVTSSQASTLDGILQVLRLGGAVLPTIQQKTDSDAAGSKTGLTLVSNPLATSLVLGFIRDLSAASLAANASYSELFIGNGITTTTGRAEGQYIIGTTNPAVTWQNTGSPTNKALLAFEFGPLPDIGGNIKRLGGVPFMALNPGVW